MSKASPQKPEGRKGVNPEWANLPRRKCDNDGKWYKPYRPMKEGERGFCCANCRKDYHKHGGAYRKLKSEMQKMVTKEFKVLRESLIQQIKWEVTDGIALSLSTPVPSSNLQSPR